MRIISLCLFVQCYFYVGFSLIYPISPLKVRETRGFLQKCSRNPLTLQDNVVIPPDNTSDKVGSFIRLFLINTDGQEFGVRHYYHQMRVKRKMHDPQIWTHLFFVIACLAANRKGVHDLCLLLASVLPLSLAYHWRYEKPGKLALVEGFVAKVLFVYGFAQLFKARKPWLLVFEVILALGTLAVYIVTNLRKDLYDPWHVLLHVVPSLWALLVACFHGPLVVL